MADKLLPDNDFTEGALVDSLKAMLAQTPNDICIYQAWDGDRLRAFVIAFAPPQMNHVFVHQAWADPTLPDSRVQDRLFDRLCVWAESIDRNELRAETVRNPEAFLRKWGFQPFSAILALKLDDIEREVSNGTDVKSAERIATVQESTNAAGASAADAGPTVGDAEPTDGLSAESADAATPATADSTECDAGCTGSCQ
ncbi:MAG: hypothetical protein IMZ62_02590 [Chloroflexi bacterium]|nr:hypothetical protein [Chloroflexota bacterium]